MLGEILVGRGHEADVSGQGFVRTNTFKGAFAEKREAV